MVPDRLWYCADCVVRGCPTCPFSSTGPARQSFSYEWGAAGWGGIVYVYVGLECSINPPEGQPLESLRTLL
jgi:hypothetical protein